MLINNSNKIHPILLLVIFTIFGACDGSKKTTAEENTRPNVIFIMSDDHANRTISAYGSGVNYTPKIDRLADEGAIFTNAFCANSICGPSRASILTGKHSGYLLFRSGLFYR